MSNKLKMTVTLDVTVPQALALQAMFDHWNILGDIGSSREVAFFVDGDGNFRPRAECSFSEVIPELTDELSDSAKSEKKDGNFLFDFDSIAWKINH